MLYIYIHSIFLLKVSHTPKYLIWSCVNFGLFSSFSVQVSIFVNKMKRIAANSKKSHFVWEEASAKFKQQRLLEDYLEVQKEFVCKKKKLQIAKQKREILLAEVRFLRRRHKHLKMQSEELEVKQGLVANSSTQSRMLANNENHSVNEVSVNNLPPVLVAHPILGGEGWNRERKEEVVLESTRVKKKRKNHTITEKRVGKKKISWQDQVALKA